MNTASSTDATTRASYLTLKQVAEQIQLKPRMVAKVARREGIGAAFGRTLIFASDDVAKIYEANRIEAKMPVTNMHVKLSSEDKAFGSLLRRASEKKTRRR
jgi:hypothetical protein